MEYAEIFLASLRLPARMEMLSPALDFVEAVARQHGLPSERAGEVRLVTEEACVNVIHHAFDEAEEGHFEVALVRRPSQLVIAIEDQGLPVDFREVQARERVGIGFKLMKAFADEVRFINVWHKGKRVEIIKNLPFKDITDLMSDEDRQQLASGDQTQVETADLRSRFMTADDAMPMARCVYRSYGYTYPIATLYYPEKLKEALDYGLMTSCVVVNESDEIVGHLALTFDRPGARIADSGKAVVDPRYRGHSLFKRMKGFLIEHARRAGLFGIFSESVSIHPYTQKGNLKLGAHETGIMLGFAPGEMNFKKISDDQSQRQAVVIFYLKTNQEPHRVAYLPARHRGILEEVYRAGQLDRSIETESGPISQEATTRLRIDVVPEISHAYVRVVSYGDDFEAAMKYRLREICEEGVACIYADLPVSEPGTATHPEALEKMGFFFSCIIPEFCETGDILRFQYLNNVPVDPDRIKTASPLGAQLLQYVLEEKARRFG